MNLRQPESAEKGVGTLLHLPYLPVAELPTPVSFHEGLAREYGMSSFHVKRDDQTHPQYGGNKVRKLGFLLAQARCNDHPTVLTFGGAGSNHALATAIFAQQHGMRALLVLGPQHNSRHVRANLLQALQTNAVFYACPWKDTPAVTARAFHDAWKADGIPPCVIPPGGSSPFGAAGYVNAAFELRRQVEAGLLPEPDVVYVASGTMGTCVGLALGLAAAGMKTRIMAVRVTKAPFTSPERASRLFAATQHLLRRYDAAFPEVTLNEKNFVIRDEFYGKDYALFTPEGVAAIRRARQELDLQLEGTYTGKAFAALLADGAAGNLANKNVLFWNTYAGDGAGAPAHTAPRTWRDLPEPLRTYFRVPVQPLDGKMAN